LEALVRAIDIFGLGLAFFRPARGVVDAAACVWMVLGGLAPSLFYARTSTVLGQKGARPPPRGAFATT